MKFRLSLPCAALASLLSCTGVFAGVCPNPDFKAIHERLRPLGELIARGEGDYNAVNRGWAGDTPGGIQGLTGMTFENYTVNQVIDMQRNWLYAVGRYQFIPSTLRFALRHSQVDGLDMFTPETQDKLMAALVLYKRPAVGAYLRGDHDLEGWALNEMAREWASIEYRHGRGYYDHIGGNRARISRAELSSVLRNIKDSWHTWG
ncbi:lysozyme-like domain protein [Synechococcus phage S-CRES1]|nr:lysozyme-like domain protein [Synechococcus phage S-CRES1]